MTRLSQWLTCVVVVSMLLAWAPASRAARTSAPPLTCAGEQRALCERVLPGAERFEPEAERPWLVGRRADGARVGWIIRSVDVVDIKAYSSKPLVTLVGLDPAGTITGARVVHHSEPILLVGIPEQKLHDFASLYRGMKATTKVVVGSSPDPEAVAVDVISGATVTALAQNQTILESARRLGVAVGAIEAESLNKGRFVQGEGPWTFMTMWNERVFGRLTVTEAEMGTPGSEEPFVDIIFTVADAPHIGRGLLGDRTYERVMGALQPGEHLVVILGNGSSSFKGSGFVRGGIFDRIRIEQGMRTVVFRDTDYEGLGSLADPEAPRFKEAGLFIARDGALDPGAPFDFIFIGSRYNMQGGYSRDFVAFEATHQLPESVYVVDEAERDLGAEITAQAWYNQRYKVAALGAFLLGVMGLFVARRWLTGTMKRLQRAHVAVMLVAFVGAGLVLGVQPSVTQVLTFVGSVVHDFSMDLFLSEPLVFVFWIFIGVVTLTWGRGVFCGWTCPYGAMSELLFKLARKLGLPELELPLRYHRVARLLRYVVLAALIGTFLYSSELGEQLAEIEPFKSTFYVAPWTREALFLGWWIALLGAAVFVWRPFCQYLCPLGAALAIPGSVRFLGPKRRRFCSSCQICTKGCEPRAIRGDGSIDPRDCLSCMECEANYRADAVCPPLIALDRLRLSAHDGKAPDPAKLARAERNAETVRRPRKEVAEA